MEAEQRDNNPTSNKNAENLLLVSMSWYIDEKQYSLETSQGEVPFNRICHRPAPIFPEYFSPMAKVSGQ